MSSSSDDEWDDWLFENSIVKCRRFRMHDALKCHGEGEYTPNSFGFQTRGNLMDSEEDKCEERVRIKVQLKNPNPLFVKWIKEWLEEAKKRNMQLQYNLQEALASLQKFPLPLKSGKECMILEHFGTGLCMKLDRKLNEYRKAEQLSKGGNAAIPGPSTVCGVDRITDKNPISYDRYADLDDKDILNHSLNKNLPVTTYDSTSPKNFTAIGIADDPPVTCDLEDVASSPRKQTTKSPTKRTSKSPTKNNNSPTKRKIRNKSPKKNCQKDLRSEKPMLTIDDDLHTFILSQASSAGTCSQPLEEQFQFYPGNFSVKLLVDTAETLGNNPKRTKREDEAINYLTELGVPYEVRHLNVGDFVWVCQDGSSKELLLPFIVERKRLDDLASSIKDGRFREQKFRLKQLQVKERIYLVEKMKRLDHGGMAYSALMQAVTNTQVVDGFKIKFTRNLKDSMQYLATMTSYLNETFSKKILISCAKEELPPFKIQDDVTHLMTFKDFSKNTSKKKKFTVGEMFIRQLLQLRGLSLEKAKTLVALFPTPTHLMEAYSEECSSDKRTILARLKVGPLGRSFGPVLSQTIHDLYTKKDFD